MVEADKKLENADAKVELLKDEELSQVQAGIALLLPAVQSAREAARGSSSSMSEQFTLNYTKIEWTY